jgi:hypothetical protein
MIRFRNEELENPDDVLAKIVKEFGGGTHPLMSSPSLKALSLSAEIEGENLVSGGKKIKISNREM